MRVLIPFAFTLIVVSTASAGSYTFLTPGAGVDLLPIGDSRAAGDEFQEVYSSTLFGASPVELDSIAFSSSAHTGGADATLLSGDVDLTLSTTSTLTPGAPGTWSLANEGADKETVFSGSFSTTVLHNSTFDIVFTFATPFIYDPSLGDLLLDFDWVTAPTANGFIGLSASFSSPLIGTNSDTVQFGNFGAADTGVATQFNSPEPGTWLLALSALLGGAIVTTRRRRRRLARY
jgi:hypothetical protein